MSLITNLKNRGLRDILNPKKWLIYLKHLAYKWGEPIDADKEDANDVLSYSEQVVMRSILCPQCVKAGKCVGDGTEGSGCGCLMPDAIIDRINFCSEGQWGEMLPTDQWNEYKTNTGLTLKIEIV